MIIVPTPLYVVLQYCIVYPVYGLLAAVFLPELAHPFDLSQHPDAGFTFVGAIDGHTLAAVVLLLSQFDVFIYDLPKGLLADGQLF